MSELGHFITDKTPYGWNTQPLWSLFRRRKKTGFSNEELLSVYRDHGVIPKSSRDDNHNKESDDLSGYQLVSEGSLVTNKMKAWQGSIAISRYRGIVSPAYYVYEPLSAECDQFLHYLLRSELYISLYGRISKGVRVNQWDLEHAALRAVPVALPDLPTQKAIADFLDRETARIDQLIEKKQRIVEVLGEKRQAVISRAVTKGLDADIPMKYSGVEWLGKIPKHWDVRRLGQIGTIRKCNGGTKADTVPEGIPCIRYGDLYTHHSYVIKQSRSYVSSERASDYTPIRYGDILFAASGETIDEIGKSAVNLITTNACCGGDVIRLRIVCEVSAQFMGYATDSPQAAYQKACVGRGITVMHIYGDRLKYLSVAIPYLHEQHTIAAFLDQKTAKIGVLVTKIQSSVERLREFRSALITAAVTGQIDVSTWGKQGTADRRLDQIEAAPSA